MPEAQRVFGFLGVWPVVVQLRAHAGGLSQGFHVDTVEVFQI